MAIDPNAVDVATQFQLELQSSGRDSRRMRSHNFWSAFGVERRTPASIARVGAALLEAGLAVRSPGDELGKEGRDDWIVICRSEQEAPIHISPPEPPGKVSLSADSARYPVEAAPTESGIAEAAAPPYRVRVAQTPTTTTPITTQTQAPANSALTRLLAFVRRHPVVSLLILLLFLAKPMLVILPGALVWLWRLFRSGSLQPVTRFAGQHKAGMLITSGLAGASVMALAAITGSPSAEERSVPAVAPAVAPAATATADAAVAPSAEAATATEQATDTAVPATLTATETSLPPTATPVPPTPRPPTAAPPIDINPNQDQNCDSFPDYQTMSAWRGYWIARGIRNPGRLDGDGDGKACEDGEGGRPAAAPPPPPVQQNVAPPPPVDSGGGGGGSGCCKTCNPAKSKPCGDSCISLSKTCHKGAGCACSGG